jgi:hypothetical protein
MVVKGGAEGSHCTHRGHKISMIKKTCGELCAPYRDWAFIMPLLLKYL